jgi:hypothetical protein
VKLSQYNTKIFVSELSDLSHMLDRVMHQATTWIDGQEARGRGGVSQYQMQQIRMGLENQLNELREKLALVYDFQGDRGMADFAPAGFNNGNEGEDNEEDEEEGVDPFDFSFFPGKEKKVGTAMVLYDPEVAQRQLQLVR